MDTITNFVKSHPIAVAGAVAFILLSLGVLWYMRDNNKTGKRLMGLTVSGGSNGLNYMNAKECRQACGTVPNAKGFAQWDIGKKCWCVGEPFQDPMWKDDPQWTSGLY